MTEIGFERCPICRVQYVTGLGTWSIHRCKPKWLAWDEDVPKYWEFENGPGSERIEKQMLPTDTDALEGNGAHAVFADDAEEAAEMYAAWRDEDGCNDRDCVFVRPYDDEEAVPKRFYVGSELVREYHARELGEREHV